MFNDNSRDSVPQAFSVTNSHIMIGVILEGANQALIVYYKDSWSVLTQLDLKEIKHFS